MNTSNTLESVQADFTHWRQTKKNPKAHTPKGLKRKAVALLAHTKFSHVTQALGLSSTILKQWVNQANSTESQAAQKIKNGPIDFIQLPSGIAEQPAGLSELKLELTQANGNHWQLHGPVCATQLEIFVRMLSAKEGVGA